MAVNGSSHNSVAIQVNCEATAAATMKARKEDDKKIKDARIAASTKMAEDIFGQNVLNVRHLQKNYLPLNASLRRQKDSWKIRKEMLKIKRNLQILHQFCKLKSEL